MWESRRWAQPMELFLVQAPFHHSLQQHHLSSCLLCVCVNKFFPSFPGPRCEPLIQDFTNTALVGTYLSNLDALEIFKYMLTEVLWDYVSVCFMPRRKFLTGSSRSTVHLDTVGQTLTVEQNLLIDFLFFKGWLEHILFSCS